MARRRKKRRGRMGHAEPDPMIRAFRVCQSKFGNSPNRLYGCEAGVEFLDEEQRRKD